MAMTTWRYDYEDLPALLERLDGDEKHEPSAHSTLDVLWVLYRRFLNVDAAAPEWPERDRFLLSKGHGPMAYYAVLAAAGFFDGGALDSFGSFDSTLGHHPDRNLVPGVELASGSLGHGLSIAVGMSLALRAQQNETSRVVCLLGDAEFDEGSNHEAMALAGRFGLERLIAIVVDNRSATYGWPGGIAARFAVEGWTTATVPGRDHDAIESALHAGERGRPHVVVAEVEAK